MAVRGKRGFIGKGYSLKNTNGTKNGFYVVVWDHGYAKGKSSYESFKHKIMDERANKKAKHEADPSKEEEGYTYIDGWHSCGNWNDPETWEKLERHLAHRYGSQVIMDEVREHLTREYERLEIEREKKMEAYRINYELLCASRGETPKSLPSIKSYKYHIKKLEAMEEVAEKK